MVVLFRGAQFRRVALILRKAYYAVCVCVRNESDFPLFFHNPLLKTHTVGYDGAHQSASQSQAPHTRSAADFHCRKHFSRPPFRSLPPTNNPKHCFLSWSVATVPQWNAILVVCLEQKNEIGDRTTAARTKYMTNSACSRSFGGAGCQYKRRWYRGEPWPERESERESSTCMCWGVTVGFVA